MQGAVAGDVRKNNLKEIWENSTLFKKMRLFKLVYAPIGYESKCYKCKLKRICGGVERLQNLMNVISLGGIDFVGVKWNEWFKKTLA